MSIKKFSASIIKCLLFAIATAFLLGVLAPNALSFAVIPQPVRVVCIGDSITEGVTVNGQVGLTYRYELWKKFVDADIDVQFLGRSLISPFVQYKGKTFPTDHLGWGGKRIEDVNQYLKDGQWGTADSGFDIAIILIGHNNAAAWDGRPRPTVAEFNQFMKDLIATVRAKQPDVKIIFQQTPNSKPYTIPDEYFNEYKNIADQSNTTESPLYYVPSPANFDKVTDTSDSVHPNPKGEAKIAKGMWNEIQYLVGAATPTPVPKPSPPTINKVLDTVKTLSGKAVTGGIVSVTAGTKKYTSKVYAKAWKVALSAPLKAGTKITAFVTLNKIPSLSKSVFVIPAIPKVLALKSGATKIMGTASKGGTVYAKIGSNTYNSKADLKTGKFTIKCPKLKKFSLVAVKCKAGGQTGDTKTVRVA